MFDIKARLAELVAEDPSRARDKDVLVRMVDGQLSDKEKLGLFRLLLSEYINHHVRRPTGPRTGKSPGTSPAVVTPAAIPHQRALLMEQAGKRPLFIPSLVSGTSDGWVAYGDMTEDYWRQYVESRRRISRISSALADWGSNNMKALAEYKVETSGKLPENIRESLLRRMPQTSGRELADVAPRAVAAQAVTSRA